MGKPSNSLQGNLHVPLFLGDSTSVLFSMGIPLLDSEQASESFSPLLISNHRMKDLNQ